MLQQLNAPFEIEENGIRFYFKEPLKENPSLETGPYPNFLTDMQQPFVTLLTQCKGISTVHETVYEQRFGYTKTLIEMGAHIQLSADCCGELPCRFKNKNFLHHLLIANRKKPNKSGAGEGTRTHDLRFTKPLLYQLSYSSPDLCDSLPLQKTHLSRPTLV